MIVGLAFLQVLNAEKDLLSCLAAYAAIALASLIALGSNRTHSSADPVSLCATAIFFGYVITRALTSPAPYIARADLYCTLAALVLYGLIAFVFSNPARRIALILALLAFGVVHVLVSAVQAGFGENLLVISSLENVEPSSRGTGLYVNPDHLAGLLEVLGILGLSVACWSRRNKWSKVLIAYVTGVAYLGVLLTGSRGGYLSVVASLIVFTVLSFLVLRPAGSVALIKVGGSGLLLLIVALTAAWLSIQQSKTLRTSAENIFTIDQGRIDLWRAAVEQWKLRPLIGTGSGTFLFYGRQFRSETMQLDPIDAHNDYLQLLAEYGLLGAVGFALFFSVHIRYAWRNFLRLGPKRVAAGGSFLSDRLSLNIAAISAVAAYVIHSAVDFNMHIPANALLLAFVFGILANPGASQPSEDSLVRPSRLPSLTLFSLGTFLFLQCGRLLPGEYFAEQAREALRDEDPATAISLARKALGYELGNPDIFFHLGRAQIALANRNASPEARTALIEQALPAFKEAQRLVPLDGSYPMEIARVYDRLGRFHEAEAMYQIALARDPRSNNMQQSYEAHLELGRKTDSTEPISP